MKKYKSNTRVRLSLFIKRFIYNLKKENETGIATHLYNEQSTLFHVSNKSYIEKQILNHQNHSGYLLDVMSQFLKPNKIFIDVGANIGSISIPLAKFYQSKGTEFHLFEPNPSIYKRLKSNINLNGLSNIVVNQIGLSSSSGKSEFYIPSPESFNQGTSSFSKNVDIENLKQVQVNISTLDEYIVSKNIKAEDVCLIKLDVQGHEYKVLEGAQNLLSNNRCTILLEYETIYDSADFNYSKNMRDMLLNNNYIIYKINRFNPDFLEKVDTFSGASNYICIKKL